ncbi:MAG: hypothetical protein ACXACU_07070 [Candidatus Hodarchaeales archaeon]
MENNENKRGKEVPKIDLIGYIKNKQDIQSSMTNISIQNLFLLLERGDPFTTISRQILLAESIELISGIVIPRDILEYRGFLLNIERAMTYFYLFHKIFHYYEDSHYSQLLINSFIALQHIFEIVWEFRFPWGIIRPAAMLKPISSKSIPKIKKILINQKKIAYKIARKIQRSSVLKSQLNPIKTLSKDDIRKTGLTGSIGKTIGILPRFKTRTPNNGRTSAQYLSQYAYTDDNSLWNLLRINYVELILALNRSVILLKPFDIKTIYPDDQKINGEITQSFQTVLGDIYLTINISNNKVNYYNYISPLLINKFGMEEMLKGCPISLSPLILLFYHPEILGISEQLP